MITSGGNRNPAKHVRRHARRLTGVDHVHALVGGLHLSGPVFEPVIGPTIAALSALGPELISAGHCTGWRAQAALATAFPDAWVPASSGTTHHLTST